MIDTVGNRSVHPFPASRVSSGNLDRRRLLDIRSSERKVFWWTEVYFGLGQLKMFLIFGVVASRNGVFRFDVRIHACIPAS